MVQVLSYGYVDENWSLIDMGTDKIRMWKHYYPNKKESGVEIIYLGGIFRISQNPNNLHEEIITPILDYFRFNESAVIH